MNQSLDYEVLSIMPAATDPELALFESATATIQQRTNTVSVTGQPDLTDWDDISDLTDIPCMFSVARPAMPNQGATVRTAQQSDTETQYHVLLNGYYPAVLQSNQVVITILSTGVATAYMIMAVESDSQQQQTRLACRAYTL
jgi:hypothetical protein